MSHGIEQNDVTIFGKNTPAWHGLGKVFAGLLSPLRAYAEGVGLADVEQLPCIVNGLRYADQKALVGVTQTGERIPLSIVGADYGVLKDGKVFELLEKVYGGRAVVETAGTLRNCKRLWVLVRRDAAWSVGNDLVQTYDLWVNRHDGSGCFELYRTNVRVVCQNTWNMAVGNKRARVFGVRHTVNVEQGVAQACNLLEMLAKNELEEQRKAIALSRTSMSGREAGSVFASLLGVDLEKPLDDVPTKTRNALDTMSGLFLRGTGNIGRTRWDAFNAVTEYVDHARTVRTTEGRNRSEVRFESTLMGSGDDMKARAFDLLTV